MTPLWFWEQPTVLVLGDTAYHHWVRTETGVYFDGQLIGTGSFVDELIHDVGEFIITLKETGE